MTEAITPWYKSWFNSPWYTQLYQHRTEQEAHEAVQLVRDIAGLSPGAKVLDLCCGFGRHAYALAEHGYQVTGLDGSDHLISIAKQRFPHENVQYVIGDMRADYRGAPYDAVVNFFTSFGYFDTHEENQLVIDTVAGSLASGGVFVIDFFNASLVRKTLKPESMNMVGETMIIQERRIEEPYVRKRITVNVPCSAEHTFEEQVRLYSPEELMSMIAHSGLHASTVYGSYEGGAFDEGSSERCIIIATKP
jgi:SAM-dependent methyltransferase